MSRDLNDDDANRAAALEAAQRAILRGRLELEQVFGGDAEQAARPKLRVVSTDGTCRDAGDSDRSHR